MRGRNGGDLAPGTYGLCDRLSIGITAVAFGQGRTGDGHSAWGARVCFWPADAVAAVIVVLFACDYFLAPGLSTEQRTLFASGVLVVLGAGYALDRLPIHVSLWRLGLFATMCAVRSPRLAVCSLPDEFVWRDELLVLLPVAALVPFVLSSGVGASARVWRAALVVVALIPVAVAWGPFDPVQTTTVMFRKPDTAVTKSLNALAEERADGAIAAF